jgi:probable rRNA maturation factor
VTVLEGGGGILVHLNRTKEWTLPRDLLEAAVLEVARRGGVEEGEISLTFVDDQEIQALNMEYLGKDRPTDVIAFALQDVGAPVLGDIYVGYDQAGRQARELGIELEEELLRLAVHGTLHVLGHEHPEGDERMVSEMFRIQEEVLKAVRHHPHSPG